MNNITFNTEAHWRFSPTKSKHMCNCINSSRPRRQQIAHSNQRNVFVTSSQLTHAFVHFVVTDEQLMLIPQGMRAFSGCDIWMRAHFFDVSRKPPNVITRLHDAASILEVTSSFIVGTSPVPDADLTRFRHYKLLDVNAVKNFLSRLMRDVPLLGMVSFVTAVRACALSAAASSGPPRQSRVASSRLHSGRAEMKTETLCLLNIRYFIKSLYTPCEIFITKLSLFDR